MREPPVLRELRAPPAFNRPVRFEQVGLPFGLLLRILRQLGLLLGPSDIKVLLRALQLGVD